MVTRNDGNTWSVADARARFSELMRRARRNPQVILSHGRPVATVIHPESLAALEQRARPCLDDALEPIRRVMKRDGYEFEIPERRDRENPFEKLSDDSSR